MNRYLMLTAAALVGSTSGAVAGQAKLTIDNGCDVWTISWHGNQYAYVDDYRPCGFGSILKGMGVATRTKGFGKNVSFPIYDKADLEQGFYVSLDFQLPFKTGKKVYGYYTTNGISVTNYIQTTYEVVDRERQNPGAM